MNILKKYPDLEVEVAESRNNELEKVDRLSNYFSKKYVWVCLNYLYYNGNNYIMDFMKLIKANPGLAKAIKDISVNDIVKDDIDSNISIRLKGGLIKIDLENKKVDAGYKKEKFYYSNDFLLKSIKKPTNELAVVSNNNAETKKANVDEKNISSDKSITEKKVDDTTDVVTKNNVSNGSNKTDTTEKKPDTTVSKKDKENAKKGRVVINRIDKSSKENPIGKYIDLKDPISKSIISVFWSNDNVKFFKTKISDIISKIPVAFKEEFSISKFYTEEGVKANINDFTLIGKTGKKMHCILKKDNAYDCSIV